MRVGIYVQPTGTALGGVDCLAAVLAHGLAAAGHTPEIVHHKRTLDAISLQKTYGLDMAGVATRLIPRQPDPFGTATNPLQRYRQARRWHEDVSAPYDCSIAMVTEYPPYCHNPNGILYVVFPSLGGFDRWPFAAGGGRWRSLASRAYHRWEWRRRLATYRHHVAISEYTRRWTMSLWGFDCETIYPPVDLVSPARAKEPMLLSVGRFDPWKKHAELLSGFAAMDRAHAAGWSFTLAGGVDHREYFDDLAKAANGRPVKLVADANRGELRELYGRAAIYWHAAGFGNDDARFPGQTEHFGITTVEAMAAGCVPVVINKAGQREIVEHGVSGFLWNDLDELRRYTQQLIDDISLRDRMAAAARERSRRFGPDPYVTSFRRLIDGASVGSRAARIAG